MNNADIAAAESAIGCTLSDELKLHYLDCNGGMPEPYYIVKEGREPLSVHQFLDITDDGPTNIVSTYTLLRDKGLIRMGLIPFAVDAGGNFYCVDHAGRVFRLLMDVWSDSDPTEEERAEAEELLARTFNEFVGGFVDEEAAYG